MKNKVITTELYKLKSLLESKSLNKDDVSKKLSKFWGEEVNIYFNIKTNLLSPKKQKDTLNNEKVPHKIASIYLDTKKNIVVAMTCKHPDIASRRAFIYDFEKDYFKLDLYNWNDDSYEFVGVDKNAVKLLIKIAMSINQYSKITEKNILQGDSFNVF
jgi:hypothetical protein